MDPPTAILEWALSQLAEDDSVPNSAPFDKLKECLGRYQNAPNFPPPEELQCTKNFIVRTFMTQRIACLQRRLLDEGTDKANKTTAASQSPVQNTQGSEEEEEDYEDEDKDEDEAVEEGEGEQSESESNHVVNESQDEDTDDKTDEERSEVGEEILETEEEPILDPDRDPLLISVHHPITMEWNGGGAGYCRNNNSFVSTRWIKTRNLSVEATSIRFEWTYNREKTYITTFYAKKGIRSDFLLGKMRFDPQFNNDLADPVVLDFNEESGTTRTDQWVQSHPTPQILSPSSSPVFELDTALVGDLITNVALSIQRKKMESLPPIARPPLGGVYTESSASTKSTASSTKRKASQGSQGRRVEPDTKSKSGKSSTTNKSTKSGGKASKSDKGTDSKESAKSTSWKSAKSNASTIKADSAGRQKK